MKIQLPRKIASDNLEFLDAKVVVLVGSNGSGKTRLGSFFEIRNYNCAHRISAQKSLSMPSEVSTISKEKAELNFLYGESNNSAEWLQQDGRMIYRWGNKPNTFLLNDFEKLMVLLHTEEYESSLIFTDKYTPGQTSGKPNSKLDRIKKIWENVLPHRKLIKRAGKIETYPSNDHSRIYNSSDMSDGERIIFYLIGEVICAKENSLIILDEPEMHLHKSITKNLWDQIEQERQDCTFIYLTHDIDFATSRQNAKMIWVKSFESNDFWDYEILPDDIPLPEQLYLEILGSRKPILFIEGDNKSTDYKLYPLIFPEYTVTPLGSCEKVFDSTKAFNENKHFHNLDAKGLIDRDRRDILEIKKIIQSQVWVPKVAEVDNFFLLEEIIGVVALHLLKDKEDVIKKTKEKVVELFKNDIESQSLEHTIFRIKRIFAKELNPNSKNISDLKTELSQFWNQQDFDEIYNNYNTKFKELIQQNNYNSILEVYNHKGLLSICGVLNLCGLAKKIDYINLVISILKESKEDCNTIKSAILNMIEK